MTDMEALYLILTFLQSACVLFIFSMVKLAEYIEELKTELKKRRTEE